MMQSMYERLSREVPAPALLFLNYGLYERGARYRWLRPEDRPHRLHLSLVRRVLAGIPLEGRRVLEVSSGRGGNCYYLRQYARAGWVAGLDRCPHNVLAGRRLFDHLGSLSFVCGDAEELPFAAGTFDVVLNLQSSHCYERLSSFLSEVHRVLRPGGVFAYADHWYLDQFPYNWAERDAALAAAPFVPVSEEDVSEEVFRALRHRTGISATLLSYVNPDNCELIARLVEINNAFRLYLAAGACRFRIVRLRRQA